MTTTEENKPLVSIIVRTKDRPKLLMKALKSIHAQKFRPIEVIIVNDGGCDLDTDVMKGILGDISLRYINLDQNTGRANAGNAGVENSKGEYIGFLDDDDEFYPEHLSILTNFLIKSDYMVAYTDSLMVYKAYNPSTQEISNLTTKVAYSQDFDYYALVLENYIPLMCLLFRREVFIDSGGFDKSLNLYEDWDLLIRIGKKYPFFHINQTTSNYNQWDTDQQISHRNKDQVFLKQSYLKVVSKHIDKITDEVIHHHVSKYAQLRNFCNELKDLNHHLETSLNEKDSSISSLKTSLNEKDSSIKSLETLLNEKDSSISSLETMLKERGSRISNLESTLREKDRLKAIIENTLQQKEAHIQRIYSGQGWKLLTRYFKARDSLLPEGTKRRLFVKLVLKVMVTPKELLGNLNKANIQKFLYYLKISDPTTLGKKIDQKLSYTVIDQGTPAGAVTVQNISPKDNMHFSTEVNATERDYVPLSYPHIPKTDIKLIAFYLPQFHPIKENDEWWGKGFTEWTNVTKALPQFKGHYQPRLPGELGFYDLRIPEVLERQVELAKQYGLHGFCFHFYWFNGKTLLEKPIKHFSENCDFPFCINWANENWTRTWDGKNNEILIAQKHSPEDDIDFIKYISKYFNNKNYIRIKSKPLLIIYRPLLLPNPKASAKRWREWCLKNGIGEIYIAATHSFEHVDPGSIGFDAVIEFPPNTFPLKEISKELKNINPGFKGVLLDYRNAIELSNNYIKPAYKKFRGICPSWDNESRRPGGGTVLVNATPDNFKRWLKVLCHFTHNNFDSNERLIFVNAWNEWAEGAYLEPDHRFGYAYLEATAEAISSYAGGSTAFPGRWKILFVSHDACRGGAQSVLLNIIAWLRKNTFIDLKILCLDKGEWLCRFRELGDTLVLSDLRNKGLSEEDIVQKVVEFSGGLPDLIYGNTVVAGREYRLLHRLKRPIITHFHELEMSVKRYAADFIGDVWKHSSHFIVCSRAVKEYLVKNNGVDQSKITTVYSSISPENFIQIVSNRKKREIRKSLGIEENKFIVFGCGIGMAFRKGAHLFIEVARALRQKGADKFHLYWIGDFDKSERNDRYGRWADHLTAMKKDNLDRYVTFLGKKDNPREYLQAGDVFLLPSLEEPLGLVALEAAECGLPTICFADAGGILDFIEDDAGFAVPYKDVEAMAEKVFLLKENEDLRRQLGIRAREKLLSSFTPDKTVPHILSACRKVSQKKPAVSIIVPNYNHARYLTSRLDSIFNQTFRDFEVILLDDASTDNSLEVLEKYSDFADVRIVRNEKNSGSPFRQWLKGIDLAKADIVWIAESDDRCETQFLETLLPSFQNPALKLAYADSYVIDKNDRMTGDYINCEYLTSLSRSKWKKSYQISATKEINDGLGVKNTILNFSAVLFRKFDLDQEFRKTIEGMSIAGDWYFIVHAIKDGIIHYEAKKLNYHRRHEESVIGKALSDEKTGDFFRAFHTVQEYILYNYKLEGDFHEKWESYLRTQWNEFCPGKPFEELKKYYPLDEMREIISQNEKIISNTQNFMSDKLSNETIQYSDK